MKSKLNVRILTLFILGFAYSYAQQQPYNLFYRYTLNSLNPAVAGAHKAWEVATDFRFQWQGVEDAPRYQTFLLSAPVGKRIGLGLSAINDKVFVEQQTTMYVDVSYALPISVDATLFLGIKAGGRIYSLDASRIDVPQPSDPYLQSISGEFRPNVGVGMYLTHKDFYISLSAPRLLDSKKSDLVEGRATTVADRIHVYLSGGYDVDISSDLTLRPSIMLRNVEGADLLLDVTAALRYMGNFEAGLVYRSSNSFGDLILAQVFDGIRLGYGYENALQRNLLVATRGSHEFLLLLEVDKLLR